MGIFEFEDKIELHTKSQSFDLLDFDDDLLFGYFFKDIVVLMLDKCDYEVYPYGYESFFPNLKRRLYDCKSTEVASRVRYTPDILVRSADGDEVELVEVKARSAHGQSGGIMIKEMSYYRQYWQESIVVLVIPVGNYFYAQHVSKLDDSGIYRRDRFQLFEDIFPRAATLSEDYRRKMVRKVLTLFQNRSYCNL